MRRGFGAGRLKPNPRRIAALLIALCVAALSTGVPMAANAENAARLSFRRMGTAIKGNTIIYQEARRSSEVIAELGKGEQCEILSGADAFVRVRFAGKIGYVRKGQLTSAVVPAEIPEALCGTVSLQNAMSNRHTEYLTLQGTITAEQPLEALFLCVWDDRRQRVEYTYAKDFDEPMAQVDAALLQKALPENRLTGGRKTLVVEGVAAGETVVLYRTPLYAFGGLEEPAHVTDLCGGIPSVLRDGKVRTAWVPRKKQPSLVVRIPAEARAALLTLEWKHLPESFTVALLDERGQPLSATETRGAFCVDAIPITPQTRSAVITPSGENAALATLRVYAEGYPAHAVQRWEPLPDKLDILLLSTHQDDEFLFFGGSIPYYAAREDVTIGVLYMADCGRHRYREALEGLWAAGLRHYPIFLGLEDLFTRSAEEAKALWREDDPERLLVRAIRRYKPEVLLVQDFGGEYAHGQHIYTARLATDALPLAASAAYDPESADAWGAWQVKKCYVHLYSENQIEMDWNVPLDASGVITPLFLAWEGYDKYKSQLASFSMERDGVQYNNALFGLYWSSVGADVRKNDFMENVR